MSARARGADVGPVDLGSSRHLISPAANPVLILRQRVRSISRRCKEAYNLRNVYQAISIDWRFELLWVVPLIFSGYKISGNINVELFKSRKDPCEPDQGVIRALFPKG